MKIKNILNNDNTIRIISVVIAVFTWIFVVVVINPGMKAVVRNIPVQVNLAGTSAERLGLELISDEELFADVTVTGDRTVVGNINGNDIEVTAVLTGISEPGTYSGIQLQAKKVSNGKTFEIGACSPSSITLKFDRKATKTLPVSLEVSDLKVADGYMLEELIASPASITVTGPENEVLDISSCIVRTKADGELTSSVVLASDIVLLDGEGKEINNPHLSLSVSTVDITIPVLKKKTVPVTFSYLNAPEGFDEKSLKYMLSNDTIEIAGPENLINQWDSINIGYIDLGELDSTREYEFDVVLPSSFVNVENVTTLLARFILNDYEVKNFKVSDIELVNIPDDYDVSVSTKSISKVGIVGPSDVVSALTDKDLTARLDMSKIDIITGQYKVPVSLYAANHNNVWAVGEYFIVLNVTAKK